MRNRTNQLLLVALFPAMMAATSPITIPLGFLPPLTLQTLFVYLAGLILPWNLAGLSMLIYLVLGAIGLPVFSGMRGGIGVFFSQSGGFLLAFPFIAILIALLGKLGNSKKSIFYFITVLILSTTVLYLLGSMYISIVYDISITAILVGFVVYIPGDIMKIVLALLLSYRLQRHIHMSGYKYE